MRKENSKSSEKSNISANSGNGADGAENNLRDIPEFIQNLSLARDLETIMFIVRKAARKIAGSDGATFVLQDKGCCYYADEDAISPLWKGKRFPMSACISGWAMQHAETVIIEDIYKDERIPVEAYRPTFVKSLAMVPIRKKSPIGAIGVYWADYYSPTETQIQELQALADSTSVAMENVQLHTEVIRGTQEASTQKGISDALRKTNEDLEAAVLELNRRHNEMLLLKEFICALQACVFVEEAYELTAKFSEKLLPNTSGAIYVMHPSRNYLEEVVAWGPYIPSQKTLGPNDCYALRRGSPYNVKTPSKDLFCTHKENNGLSYMCIPLSAQSDIIGLLNLQIPNGVEFSSNLETIANMFAEQVALNVSNIKLRQTLQKQSFRDPSTGLFNRRYLETTLEREIARARRQNAMMAILMIDIDHFKDYNDLYGHDAGDQVITALSSILSEFARQSDIACRYGGEEFILVLLDMHLDNLHARLSELHNMLHTTSVMHLGKVLPKVTISIGVSFFPDHGQDMKTLITEADKALYTAKKNGRNRDVIAGEGSMPD